MATVTISDKTYALLTRVAAIKGLDTNTYAANLLAEALNAAEEDYQDSCRGIAEGIADMEAGRTVALEGFIAKRRAERAAYHGK